MKFNKNKINEKFIIKNYLNKLNFNKKGTYNFENDGSFIDIKKNKKLIVTSDSISENIDFFKNDDPKSIACKIITSNLSDLSAMGGLPHSYLLNLFLPKYINHKWLQVFTNELYNLQKKSSFYLLGGDLSSSSKLIISANFFGFSHNNKIVNQNYLNYNDDIWVTGNIGDSKVGLNILKNKIEVKNKSINNYFLNKYYFPKPCLIGSNMSQYVKSMKDISDGFLGDLNKMLDSKYGAKISLEKIPLSVKLRNLLKRNNLKIESYINSGDDYELIIISSRKYRDKIMSIAKKNKVKVSRVGKIVKNLGIYDDSNNTLNISREFDHFL